MSRRRARWTLERHAKLNHLHSTLQEIRGALGKTARNFIVLMISTPLFNWALLRWVDPILIDLGLEQTIARLTSSNGSSWNPTEFFSILSTQVQVIGTLLGLYFAAISLAINNHTSAGAPPPLIQLLVRKFTRTGYLDSLTVAGGFSSALMAWGSLGLVPGKSTLFLATSLTIIAIISFVALGIRTFTLLSPSSTLPVLTRELSSLFLDFRYFSGSLRNPIKSSAIKDKVQTLTRDIIDSSDFVFSYREPHVSSSSAIAMNVQEIFTNYSAYKAQLPSDHPWFERRPEYQSLLAAGGTELELFMTVGVQPAPSMIADIDWLEHRLYPAYARALAIVASSEQVEYLETVLSRLAQSAHIMSQRYTVRDAIQLLESFDGATRNLAPAPPLTPGGYTDSTTLQRAKLAIFESVSAGLVNVLTGLIAGLDRVGEDTISELLRDLKETASMRFRSVYIPRKTLDNLALLQFHLAYELKIEDGHLTSDQYLNGQIARNLKDGLIEITSYAIGKVPEHILNTANSLKNDDLQASLVCAERGLESVQKSRTLIESLERLDTKLCAYGIQPDSEEHPEYSRRLLVSLRQIEDSLLTLVAESIERVSEPARYSNEFPDSFGWAYRTLDKYTWFSVKSGDDSRFLMLFPFLFNAALRATERVRVEVQEHDVGIQLALSTAFLSNLASVSGAVAVISELDEKNLWDHCEAIWKHWISQRKDTDDALKWLITIVKFHNNPWQPSAPDALITAARKSEALSWLRSRGLLGDTFDYHRVKPQKRHPSALINSLARMGDMGMWNLNDVFLIHLLKRNYPNWDIFDDLSRDQRYLLEMIQRDETQEDGDWGDF